MEKDFARMIELLELILAELRASRPSGPKPLDKFTCFACGLELSLGDTHHCSVRTGT